MTERRPVVVIAGKPSLLPTGDTVPVSASGTAVSALPAVSTLDGTELVPVVQSGASKQATLTQVAALGGTGTKISALPAVSAADDNDIFPVVQASTSKRETRAQLFTNPLHGGYDAWSAIADPSAPGPGLLRIYAKLVSGRMLPKWVGPDGTDKPFQPALFGSNIISFAPSTGTVGTGSGTGLGPAWTSNGTVSHPTPSNAAPAITQQIKRTRYANVATTTNQQLGIRFNSSSEQQFWRGNAAGLGGFFFMARFFVELIPASTIRLFAGLVATATGSVVLSDTVLGNTVGLWHDTTDALNALYLVTNNGTTTTKTPIALSGNMAAGQGFDFYMFCQPNGNSIFYRLDDINTGATLVDTFTSTTLPASTAFLQPQVQMSNGTANTAVTTTAIAINRVYVESDR